jgi:hypothetical protein
MANTLAAPKQFDHIPVFCKEIGYGVVAFLWPSWTPQIEETIDIWCDLVTLGDNANKE